MSFGLIADVHQDLMPDADRRVAAFVSAMTEARADFICHLGDFCQPRETNKKFLSEWDKFSGGRYHVLGNHDMDGGFTQKQTAAFYGMPDAYYSFDRRGIHFVVLNGNEPGGKRKGYKSYISKTQMEWLAKDLAATSLPTCVFLHQSLDSDAGIENAADVRGILETATMKSGRNKVVACFCGHHHDDAFVTINGIHYVHINSASYYWLDNKKYKHQSYPAEIHRKYPHLEQTAPYTDALWALVTVDPVGGILTVSGRKTTWVGQSPWELGASQTEIDPLKVRPAISERKLSF